MYNNYAGSIGFSPHSQWSYSSGWEQRFDQNGRSYYVNLSTGESQWEHPMEQRQVGSAAAQFSGRRYVGGSHDPHLEGLSSSLSQVSIRRNAGAESMPSASYPAQWPQGVGLDGYLHNVDPSAGQVQQYHPALTAHQQAQSFDRSSAYVTPQNLSFAHVNQSVPTWAFQGAASSGASSAETTSRTPNLIFDNSVNFELRWHFSMLKHGMPWFPERLATIRVSTPKFIEGGLDGVCSTDDYWPADGSKPEISVEVRVEPLGGRAISEKEKYDYFGEQIYVFAHEMCCHALGDAHHFLQFQEFLPGVTQHKKIFHPSNEGNAWHRVVKSLLPYVDRRARPAFLQRYVADVRNRCDADYYGRGVNDGTFPFARHNDELYEAGMAWAAILEKKASRPDDPFWQGVPETTNPMVTTDEDWEDAREYEERRADWEREK